MLFFLENLTVDHLRRYNFNTSKKLRNTVKKMGKFTKKLFFG